MRSLLNRAARIATRHALAATAAAAAALLVGAYSVHATVVSGHRPKPHTFTLRLQAKAVTVSQGSSKRLTITLRRQGLRARVAFKLVTRPPRGVTARFTPARTTRGRTILILRVSTSARLGRYRLRLQGGSGRVRRRVVLTLTVANPSAIVPASNQTASNFSLTGNPAAPMEPGVPQPIDVLITNSNDQPLSLSRLTVTVQSITAPQATPALPCSKTDFAVQPYTGPLPLTVPASSSRSLSDLGVASSQWPEISLLNLPSNQDGCQGASLSLVYSADGSLG